MAPASTILEIGCETGLSSKLMSEEGYDVTGVEISKLFLNESADFMSCNLKYCVADTERLPFGNHVFNAVVAYDVIEHIDGVAHLRDRTARFKYDAKGIHTIYMDDAWSERITIKVNCHSIIAKVWYLDNMSVRWWNDYEDNTEPDVKKVYKKGNQIN